MKRNINSLTGYSIVATDGELGEVKDFYFDDETWTIRYLIVETGSWLSGRKVLISTSALVGTDSESESFKVNLTQDQIRNSPDIDTNLPVSRQQEEVLHKHHSWENYWESSFFGGGTTADILIDQAGKAAPDLKTAGYDVHLQSAIHVSGYHIHASDGEIGHVNNFIIDDKTWKLTDFVIDTENWIGGKKVLVDVSHVESVQWFNYEVFLDITTDAVNSSPEYKED